MIKVDGNNAINLYEKYGFKMDAHILVNNKVGNLTTETMEEKKQ